MPRLLILTINTGSSSVKAGLYEASQESGQAIGLKAVDTFESSAIDELTPGSSAPAGGASQRISRGVLDWLGERRPTAIGHRVVHGGPRYREHVRITEDIIADLRQVVPIDPTHMPQCLAMIEETARAFPGVDQVACFDTAFHRHMPRVAQMYPLSRDLFTAGVIRYGFHGLSCEYIVDRLHEIAPKGEWERTIIAHLGNGCSVTAVRAGTGMDTSMGFSPTGGLMMGTRCGDLDPSVLLYLLREQRMAPEALSGMLNERSGLQAVSEIGHDMRQLLEQEDTEYRAKEAIDLYCYQAAKYIAAMTVSIEGLTTVVFTGGIGQNSAEIRQRICSRAGFLGIQFDEADNRNNKSIISASDSAVVVRVIQTDEDLMIARHTRQLLA